MVKTTTTRARVLVTEPIADEGIRLLREHADVEVAVKPDDLAGALARSDALIVRSSTRVTAETIAQAPSLQVIGRAGIGVDNVDVEAASRRGIIVVNAPTSVVTAAAEHTLALILALCRRVPQAHQSVARGEWERSRFVGTELRGKTIGIVGLGNVGAEVARRLLAFEAHVVGTDPFVNADYAARLGIQLLSFDALLDVSDIVTLHVPLTRSTRNLIGATQLARLRDGARLVNCARGGVLDEGALVEALASGRLAGAALDVFAEEPPKNRALLSSDRVVLTPHLGASTEEAQVAASLEIAQQVIAILGGRPARNAVNAPAITPENLHALGSYVDVGEKLGYLLAQLASTPIVGVDLSYRGQIAELDTTPVRSAVALGLLRLASPEHVNLMNSLLLARQRGINVVESRSSAVEDNFANLVVVRLHGKDGFVREVAGTAIGQEIHLVRVDDFRVDVPLTSGFLLFIHNTDMPGVVGRIGTLLGGADVNISSMKVGRLRPRGEAMMILAIDEAIPNDVLEQVLSLGSIRDGRLVRL
jgi:D-3-phosphoglycerate dehydrogenase